MTDSYKDNIIPEQKMEATPSTETKLSREQRRKNEEVTRHAKLVYSGLTQKFLEYLTTCNDPEGHETQEFIRQINGQWRTYHRNKGLNKESLNIMMEFCANLVNQYKEEKAKNEE